MGESASRRDCPGTPNSDLDRHLATPASRQDIDRAGAGAILSRRRTHYCGNFPATRLGGPPLSIPALAAVIRPVIERPGFSFAEYNRSAPDPTSELYEWTKRVFLEFRDLEVRLLLEELKPSLQFQL